MDVALLALLIFGCARRADEGLWVEHAGKNWTTTRTASGGLGDGFGYSLAFGGDQLLLGLPFAVPGRVVTIDGDEVLVGEGRDYLGSALAYGDHWLIGAPGAFDGRGAVYDELGVVLLKGEEKEGLGGKPIVHGQGFAVLKHRGVVSTLDDGWGVQRRLWQLCSGDFDGDGKPTLIAGIVGGGLSVSGVEVSPPAQTGDFGFALAVCELDGDGDDDLVVGAPTPGRVYLYLTDDPRDLPPPERILDIGARGGQALVCASGKLAVGAPGGGGRVWWFGDPLQGDGELVVEGESSLAAMGAALAIREKKGTLEMAVGAPGVGGAVVLSQAQQ